MTIRTIAAVLLLGAAALGGQPVQPLLERKILEPNVPLLDVQVYTGARVPPMKSFATRAEWEAFAGPLRARVLREVVFGGRAAAWRDARTKVEILEPFARGDGYTVRQFRYEIIPGMWSPGLIYEPAQSNGRVPVVLNVNGHEGNGTQTNYIQARCINLAKKGMIAVNPEWVGKGQLNTPGFSHYKLAQIDLAGASGVAIFYLQMKRAIDVALSLPNADPRRLAVTGLSGGGWQTILISSLDTRVAAAMPVAGYSSYLTRSQWPDKDLGDSEQTPSDLGATADYTYLTALLAPRPAVLAYNANDNCCFRADYAVAPLIQAATPIYKLLGAPANLAYHVNHGPGHNYDADNRERLYRLVRDAFGLKIDTTDINVEADLRAQEQLRPELPANNADLHTTALALAEGLPRNPNPTREQLARIVRYRRLPLRAVKAGEDESNGRKATYWKLRIDEAWSVPAVELVPAGEARSTVVVVADEGRAKAAAQVERLLAEGARVVAVDPFLFGESYIGKRDFLFAMLIASLGERPLGLIAGQIAAAARWLGTERKLGPVTVASIGPRTGLAASLAAALESGFIGSVRQEDAFTSLHEILTRDLTADKTPELFCFGLLEAFDIPQIAALHKASAAAR